jgi:hypothetical protein
LIKACKLLFGPIIHQRFELHVLLDVVPFEPDVK